MVRNFCRPLFSLLPIQSRHTTQHSCPAACVLPLLPPHVPDPSISDLALNEFATAPENGKGFYKTNYSWGSHPNSECANDTLNAFRRLAMAFPQITLHMHVGFAGRQPGTMVGAVATLQAHALPSNVVLAPHLNAMGVLDDAVLEKEPVGALFLAGVGVDDWNAKQKLLNVPLASLEPKVRSAFGAQVKRSYAANTAKGKARPWLVVDAALPSHALQVAEDAEYAEVSAITSLLGQ